VTKWWQLIVAAPVENKRDIALGQPHTLPQWRQERKFDQPRRLSRTIPCRARRQLAEASAVRSCRTLAHRACRGSRPRQSTAVGAQREAQSRHSR